MQIHTLPKRKRTIVALLVGALCFWAPSASALGPASPPRITFASVWVNMFSTNAFVSSEEGVPQLVVSITVEIPGGDVPTNVQSVAVTLPDGTSFVIPKESDDLFTDLSYFRNLTQAGVVGLPLGTYTFTVTDTAGGVTSSTDNLVAASALLPTATVSV